MVKWINRETQLKWLKISIEVDCVKDAIADKEFNQSLFFKMKIKKNRRSLLVKI